MTEVMKLTDRETEILSLVASGYKYPEIAEQLFLSKHTVKRHMQKIYESTSAKTLAQATALAMAHGLLTYDGGSGFTPTKKEPTWK